MIPKAPLQDELSRRLKQVLERMSGAAQRSGRKAADITLVAVSKTHPANFVRQAITAGVTDLGENRVQEAETKIPEVGAGMARWHLIGHLQSNKARRAAELFDVIHSLDSAALAKRLDRVCGELERAKLPVLIQVDLRHEPTKTGIREEQLSELLDAVASAKHVRLIGLMTVPPFFDQAEEVRPYFRRLRELRDDLQTRGAFGEIAGALSMGMTHDYEIAIEEGATMVRVGTAIFGQRE
jgi:PLP dependent protein